MGLRTLRLCGALVMCLCIATPVRAQEGSGDPTYDASGRAIEQAAVYIEDVTPAEVNLGEPFTVTARIEAPIGWELVSVRPHGNRYVELLDDEVDASANDGVVRVRATMVVYRTGTYLVEGLAALLIRPDATQVPALSDPFEVRVRSAIVNEADPQPAPSGPPMQVMTRNLLPMQLGAAAMVLLLALSGWLSWARWQRSRVPPPPPPPPRPAWEVALERLDGLETSGLLERGDHVEFHLSLSAILRQFVGGFYGFSAVESTTPEIRAELARRRAQVGEHEAALLPLLSDMDLVKFARYTPPVDQSRALMRATRGVVLDISASARARSDASETDDVPAPPEPDDASTVPPPGGAP